MLFLLGPGRDEAKRKIGPTPQTWSGLSNRQTGIQLVHTGAPEPAVEYGNSSPML